MWDTWWRCAFCGADEVKGATGSLRSWPWPLGPGCRGEGRLLAPLRPCVDGREGEDGLAPLTKVLGVAQCGQGLSCPPLLTCDPLPPGDQEVVAKCSPTSDRQCQCKKGSFYCNSVDCVENCLRCKRSWGHRRGPLLSSQ